MLLGRLPFEKRNKACTFLAADLTRHDRQKAIEMDPAYNQSLVYGLQALIQIARRWKLDIEKFEAGKAFRSNVRDLVIIVPTACGRYRDMG